MCHFHGNIPPLNCLTTMVLLWGVSNHWRIAWRWTGSCWRSTYNLIIQDHPQKGIIEPVLEGATSGPRLHDLPHHGIQTPTKITDTVVWKIMESGTNVAQHAEREPAFCTKPEQIHTWPNKSPARKYFTIQHGADVSVHGVTRKLPGLFAQRCR